MSAKKFIGVVFGVSIGLMAVLVAINYGIDMYGLFRPVKGRSIRIYSDERTSKYLLAHRYVPENFEGYILGPSLSANIDPKQIDRYKIYNLSMMGANITEQKTVVEKAMEDRTPRFVVLCLHPYLTHDHGMKTGMITPKEYYGALGSFSLYKAYALRIIRTYNLLPNKYPANQFNDYGFNDYEVLLHDVPAREKIEEQLHLENAIDASVDSVAWIEFNELINHFVKDDVKIVAYFHPLPRPLFEKYEGPLMGYQHKVAEALKGKVDTLIDFNEESFAFFSSDFSNYIDHGHLSEKGQHYLFSEILKRSGMLPGNDPQPQAVSLPGTP